MRSRIFLSTPVFLGLFGLVIYGARQSGNPANPGGFLPQNASSQNSVWGEDRVVSQIERAGAKARNSVTLLDEIDDPGERKAFLALFQKQNAEERRKTAMEFLKHYPQASFLSQAYEIAAKASIDVGDNKSAVEFGRESLRLLPENPLLLVPLADVETQQGDYVGAIRDARMASSWRSRFRT